MSVTIRISLIFLLLSGVGFYLFARQEIGETTRRYREATEEPLVDFATVLSSLVAADTDRAKTMPVLQLDMLRIALETSRETSLSARIYDLLKTTVDIRVYVTDARGLVVFDSSGRDLGKDYSQWNDVAQTLRGNYGARSSRDDPLFAGSVLYVAAPIRVRGQLLGVLTVAKPNMNANRFIEATQRSTFLLGLVSFCTVAGLAVILSFIVTRPIRALTFYVRNIRDGRKSVLPSLPTGEIRALAEAFEEMREALEGRRYVEQYVQTLTHEIKSPLTAIRGAVELLKEDPPEPARTMFMENIEGETERAEDLVKKLLSLSALQRSDQLERKEFVELQELLEETSRRLAIPLAKKHLKLRLDVDQRAAVMGDRFWLAEALMNVVQNAIEFSPQGGEILIELFHDAENAVVRVSDEGSGIPEWALEKIFDKFYSLPRPETKRRSSGLGLTIVEEVMQLHEGRVAVRNRREGGAEVALTLPRCPLS